MNRYLAAVDKHLALIAWLAPPTLVFCMGSAFILLDKFLQWRNIQLHGGYTLDNGTQVVLLILPFAVGIVAQQLCEYKSSRSHLVATLLYVPIMIGFVAFAFLFTVAIWGRLSVH